MVFHFSRLNDITLPLPLAFDATWILASTVGMVMCCQGDDSRGVHLGRIYIQKLVFIDVGLETDEISGLGAAELGATSFCVQGFTCPFQLRFTRSHNIHLDKMCRKTKQSWYSGCTQPCCLASTVEALFLKVV